jgi:hypothetical protein
MQAFVVAEPHLSIQERLDHFCDEATFVDWEQDSPDLPGWQTSYRHLVDDGEVAGAQPAVRRAPDRAFPPPAEPAPA